MDKALLIPACAALILSVGGCGHPVTPPVPPAVPGPATSRGPAATEAYVPASDAFAPVPDTLLQQAARITFDCNLDVVDGHAPGSSPLQRAGSATFTGWAADSATGAVPVKLQLVLTGKQDYAVAAVTGLDRSDVAQALHVPAFSISGYAVDADLSVVAAGNYGVTLLYSVAGQSLSCATKARITVQ